MDGWLDGYRVMLCWSAQFRIEGDGFASNHGEVHLPRQVTQELGDVKVLCHSLDLHFDVFPPGFECGHCPLEYPFLLEAHPDGHPLALAHHRKETSIRYQRLVLSISRRIPLQYLGTLFDDGVEHPVLESLAQRPGEVESCEWSVAQCGLVNDHQTHKLKHLRRKLVISDREEYPGGQPRLVDECHLVVIELVVGVQLEVEGHRVVRVAVECEAVQQQQVGVALLTVTHVHLFHPLVGPVGVDLDVIIHHTHLFRYRVTTPTLEESTG
mmetsp:Transcript_22077/g.54245  ORF Transcript_22077/g.54245 Transcript_22077/m.54245 type:complete len:268 (-) Transcript_22077:1071-1874(-)